MLIYGMGEQPLKEILRLLSKGVQFSSLKTIPQTSVIIKKDDPLPAQKMWKDISLHSFEKCVKDKNLFAENFVKFEKESNKIESARLNEASGDLRVIINPQYPPMEEKEIDRTFDLPYMYLPLTAL